MKIACLTVIYPGVEDFIEEYLQGLRNQTFGDFDLIIINDNFPLPIKQFSGSVDVKTKVFNCSRTPQSNILEGLRICCDLGYDIVLCSDADDVMFDDRVEKIVAYFSENEDKKIVYNNLVNGRFDLSYKSCISLTDILDFNVLGYGASSIKADLIPFVLKHGNEKVPVFDWWFALVYLLHFGKVDFLKDVNSYYRMHTDNYAGPVFDITEGRLHRGLYVKKATYFELTKYCRENGFAEEERIFVQKCGEINEIERFISKRSFSSYYELVRTYFSDMPKMFWWQDVLSLDKFGKAGL